MYTQPQGVWTSTFLYSPYLRRCPIRTPEVAANRQVHRVHAVQAPAARAPQGVVEACRRRVDEEIVNMNRETTSAELLIMRQERTGAVRDERNAVRYAMAGDATYSRGSSSSSSSAASAITGTRGRDNGRGTPQQHLVQAWTMPQPADTGESAETTDEQSIPRPRPLHR